MSATCDGAPLMQRTDDTRGDGEHAASQPTRSRRRRWSITTATSGRLIEIDGERPVEEVFEKLCARSDCLRAQAARRGGTALRRLVTAKLSLDGKPSRDGNS